MEAIRGLNLDGITITSPAVRLITYSLVDAYRIIVVHEQNHFVQARRALELPGFPGHAPFAGSSRAQWPIGRRMAALSGSGGWMKCPPSRKLSRISFRNERRGRI